MSDVEQWLEANAPALAAVAQECAVEARVVRLVAVLVLAGLDDQEIRDQLVSALDVRDSDLSVEAGVRTVPRIRRLAA